MLVAWISLLALASVPASGSVQDEGRIPLEIAVPRRGTARAQLEYAAGLKRRLSERKEDERDFWCELAVEAYQAVRVHHPGEDAIGAEAAFRAGELLRANGEEERALPEFEVATRLGKGTPFEARGQLEAGHVHRRAGRTVRALDLFHDVVASRSAALRRRDDAQVWVGKIQCARGRVNDAIRAWRNVSQGEGDALDRVEAFDLWACALVEEGDFEGAAGVLHTARVTLVDWSLEETTFGERVRRALERMRVVDRLTNAIDARRARADSSSRRGLSRKS